MTTESTQQTKDPLNDLFMRVTAKDSDKNQRTWKLEMASLQRHSGYFRGQLKEHDTLDDVEPEVFRLFAEYIQYGEHRLKEEPEGDACCQTKDKEDLPDESRVLHLAKAWALGEYLEAEGFQNYTMRILYGIYCAPKLEINSERPVGPKTIEYVWTKTKEFSMLQNFFTDVLVRFWRQDWTVVYRKANREQWNQIWDDHKQLRNDLLFLLTNPNVFDDGGFGDLSEYLETSPDEETDAASNDEIEAETVQTEVAQVAQLDQDVAALEVAMGNLR